ncbi:MAG: helix-turn-helix domain-containing protein [Lachnospiraceae bacterium]|nr:helix-turn-helix domain-containing protein [Lachnospiraceae bacterium]
MDSKLLGQRIKEARLAKKMTQNEVVGSFITRNMLSQIESGNAVPSMKTLTYLAKVLELPPSVLLQDASEENGSQTGQTNTPASAVSPDALTYYRAKEAYLAGDDASAYEALVSIPEDSPLSDETYALSARVALRLAASQCETENYAEALEYAKTAESAASKGAYASLEVKSQALLLLSDVAVKLAHAN